ncbi:MAG: tryptophan synthase subunit alpha [Alphaproteobacteria bacterium]|nr:tryptophan synthase subunit alpha [Alphaproteobacteria bacterium]
MNERLARRFAALEAEGRGGLILFITAGDPDRETSASILKGLAAAGADVIELGMPFSDPMADGPAIQAAGSRALKAGADMRQTLDLAREFRAADDETPVVLMGYYNPIYAYGVAAFTADAAAAGIDGLIIVDLPPEEEDELAPVARQAGIDMIRLIAPTTDDARLRTVLQGADGFAYYVSVTGVTGTVSAVEADIEQGIAQLRGITELPIAIGFGIKTPDQTAAMARLGDAAVVGSALVQRIADGLDAEGRPEPDLVQNVLGFAAQLGAAVRGGNGSG